MMMMMMMMMMLMLLKFFQLCYGLSADSTAPAVGADWAVT
jgi:hypothetical protein